LEKNMPSRKKVRNRLTRLTDNILAVMSDKPQRWVCILTPNGGHDLERLSDVDLGATLPGELVQGDVTLADVF
jgi:hypothetical protein